MKFNWSCIKRTTLDGDITAKFADIGCNYCHFARARLDLIAGDYTCVPVAHARGDLEDSYQR